MKASSLLMKEMNKNYLRTQLKLLRTATKPELASKTGLSVVTVNSLITEMLADGEVLEGSSVPSNGGRPSLQYEYNKDYGYAAIIYGHQVQNQELIQLVVVNLLGEVVHREKQYLDNIMIDSFDGILDKAFSKFESIKLIAFGLPGEEENEIITMNDFTDIVGDSFFKHYKERFQVPVLFENDINAAVYGYEYGFSQDDSTVVGIYFPRIYPPGAGIVINGALYYGVKNFAGEIADIFGKGSWSNLDYTSETKVTEIIGRLLVVYSCVLAPNCIVLYGDFWSEELKEGIRSYQNGVLQENFHCDIVFEVSIDKDFEAGMIRLALEYLGRDMSKVISD